MSNNSTTYGGVAIFKNCKRTFIRLYRRIILFTILAVFGTFRALVTFRNRQKPYNISFRLLFTSTRQYPLLFCTSLPAGLIQKFPKYAKGRETHFKALLECYLIEHVVFNANEDDLSRTKCSFEGGVVCRHFQISGKTWCHRYTIGQTLQFTRLVHAVVHGLNPTSCTHLGPYYIQVVQTRAKPPIRHLKQQPT